MQIRLEKKLAHLTVPPLYEKKYADDPMNWKPGFQTPPRHDWILKEAKGAKSLIDLGCYEGSLVWKATSGSWAEMERSRGVEMCKVAVKRGKQLGMDIVQGDASSYQDENKYDAVCACELIEHVPDPVKLVRNMLSLVSDKGWCYITTPNGCFDPEGTRKVWEDEDALIDHVRTYNKEKMAKLLSGLDYQIVENGKELYAKFRRDLAKEVESLMEDNQALKAWELVKDTTSPLKDRIWLRIRHAFDPELYKKYYRDELEEAPMPEDIALDVSQFSSRFKWAVDEVKRNGYKTVVDLGCADGYLCLTLAKQLGCKCLGVNLHSSSIKIAKERAEKAKLDCEFVEGDLFDTKGTFDAVFLMEVLEHLPDPQKAIDFCMGLLNKGGSFYLSTPSTDSKGIRLHKEEVGKKSWDDGKPTGHLRIFTDKELLRLCEKYQVEKILVDEEGNYLMEVKNNE